MGVPFPAEPAQCEDDPQRHVQNGTSVIPGSTNPDHIRENADIFDFCLTDEEMDSIKALNKNERFYNPPADMEEKYAFFAIDLDSQP